MDGAQRAAVPGGHRRLLSGSRRRRAHHGQMPALVAPFIPAGRLSAEPQPQLTDPALLLRPWDENDVPALVTAYSDPAIQRWHCRSLDADEAAATVRRWREAWETETGASWAVTDPECRVLGRVGFRELHLADGVAEVAYWVLATARGRGVARRAVTTLSSWAFDQIGLQRIELRHSVANTPSCRVATAAGFTPEGTLRGSALHADGWHDMHLHARLHTGHENW